MQGREHLFTLHLTAAGSFTRIDQIAIGGNRKKLHKTFVQAYAKAAYFEEINLILDQIFLSDETNLANFIIKSNEIIRCRLGVESRILRSSALGKRSEKKGQDRVIEICQELGATCYINAIGGRTLYTNEAFAKSGIDLKFLKPHLKCYDQGADSFVPGLSIIDVAMFNGLQGTSAMLADYELV